MLLSTGRFFGSTGGGGGGGTQWTPANLTGLIAWHDAKDLATITAASSLISAWNDKSGNSNHLSQSSNKPNYSASVQLSAVNVIDCGPCDHNPSPAQRSMSWGSAITTAKAAFAVVGTGLNSNHEGGGFLFGSSGSTLPFHRGGAFGQEGYTAPDALLSSGNADAAFTGGVARRNGLSVNPIVNGFTGESTWNIIGLISTGSAATSFNSINLDRTTSRGGGDWAEIVILNAIPSNDDIRRIEGYFKNRWATVTLPEIHPYAAAGPVVGDTPTENAVTAHRYWRFSCICNVLDTSFAGLAELQAYETIGGADVISGATFTSPQGLQSGSLASLKDGNLSTTQAQWNGRQFDVDIDLGSGNSKALIQFGFAPNKDDVNRSPKWIAVRGSNDGSTYTDSWMAKYSGSYTIGTLSKVAATSI